MLQANKANLIAELSKEALSIRQRELDYWLSVFEKFGTLAALLGGFAASVLMMEKEKRSDYPNFHLFFTLASGGAMGINLTLLTISVLCTLWAPGKALHGQGVHSYQSVIELLEEMYRHCFFLFECGLFCYFFASMFAAFCLFDFLGGLSITIILSIFSAFVISHTKRLKFILVPDHFSTGYLRGNLFYNIGDELTETRDPKLDGKTFHLSFANNA